MTKAWQAQYPSLRSWTLRNFKSVAHADLQLAPLTLVVGANSAGKSSLLQSILMMAQASNEETPGAFPLNGPLVGLGAFKEARTDLPTREGDDIKIGGEIAIPPFLSRYHIYGYRFLRINIDADDPEFAADAESVPIIDWTVALRKDPGSNGSVVHESHVTFSEAGELLGRLDAYPRRAGDPPAPMSAHQEGRFGDDYEMDQHLCEGFEDRDRTIRRRRAPLKQDMHFGAVAFRAGVPVDGLYKTTEVEYFVQTFAEYASDFVPSSKSAKHGGTPDAQPSELSIDDAALGIYELVKTSFHRFIDGFRKDGVFEYNFDDDAAAAYIHAVRNTGSSKELRSALLNILLHQVSENRPILGHNFEHAVPELAGFIPQYFSDWVRYLGPLREDPRVTYPHSIAGSTHMPLGRKGESTASVLLQGQSGGRPSVRVGADRYPLPSGASASSLWDAVKAWAREFELGETFVVTDENRHGVAFKIDTRDLTSVGTGVSQILPVIVLCLMGQPGQIILLEQPELHLNPGLQQHLADFFLAIVKTGRQLIVETHSEYVVTRLRRRVAEDGDDRVHRLFNIVFAERDQDHRTQFRVLDVDASGALGADEWPQGFFDHAGNDVEAMMRHTVKRRQGRE